jgi:hypothetical protein
VQNRHSVLPHSAAASFAPDALRSRDIEDLAASGILARAMQFQSLVETFWIGTGWRQRARSLAGVGVSGIPG